MVAPLPPNQQAANLAAATAAQQPAPTPMTAVKAGNPYQLMPLPSPDRKPGDPHHAGDTNQIIEALRALEWAYFLIQQGPPGTPGPPGPSVIYQPDPPTTRKDGTPLEAGDVWVDEDGVPGVYEIWAGPTPPQVAQEIVLWYDTTAQVLKNWDPVGQQWLLPASSGFAKPGVSDANKVVAVNSQGTGFVYRTPKTPTWDDLKKGTV